MIDAERVLGDHLLADDGVMALGARVAGGIPKTFAAPWVRITHLDAQDIGGVEHLHDFLVQFDCFAGDTAMKAFDGQAEASDLARVVRAALKAAQGQTIGDAVVSDVRFTGMLRAPDGLTGEPARERWILTASISMHA